VLKSLRYGWRVILPQEKVEPEQDVYISNYSIILELLVALLFFKPTFLSYKRWFETLMSTSVWASIITFILYMSNLLF
jgi:Ca2+/H+ antiporter